ncbi:uncharacterized protein VTP21DRAFT_5428 [Calcarisporiella thermophila]|uniref:uncharacterized protein n=1 Tax=Calcarisporiella thermophila TaxID=911321 RepID=UPI0037441BF6
MLRNWWRDYRAYVTAPVPVTGPRRHLVIPWRIIRRTNLTFWILAGMLLGILIGAVNPAFGIAIDPFAKAFIRMIQTLEVPLIFSTLVVGIAGHGDDLIRVGRLALKSLLYFFFITTIALAIGLIMANIARPGDGINLQGVSEKAAADLAKNGASITWDHLFGVIVPKSFFQAASENTVLAIVFCAVMFGVGILNSDPGSKRVMLDFTVSLSQVMFRVTELVMNYAPIGVAAALASTVGGNGIGVLVSLSKLVGTVYGALGILVLVVFVPVVLLARIPFVDFLRHVAQPMLIAFSTSSSESALPRAMKNMHKFGVPQKIVAFVIPCGYSFNLDGGAVYHSLACIFCAQAGRMELDISRQLTIMATLILSTKGIAAIPRAGLVVLSAAATQFGLPLAAVTLTMGVEPITDMARTAINVLGNCLACVVMARWEGEFRGKEWEQEMLELQLGEEEEETQGSRKKREAPDYASVGVRVESAERPESVGEENRKVNAEEHAENNTSPRNAESS